MRNEDAMEEQIAWWNLGYRWWVIRTWWHRLPDRLAWKCAWWLPRRVALLAFVRVYSAWGELGPDYDPVCRSWEREQTSVTDGQNID